MSAPESADAAAPVDDDVPAPPMPNARTFRVRLAYRGTHFSGWQRQTGQRTVQGVVEEALSKLIGVQTAARGAGRTDAGVHARAQVFSFTASTRIPTKKMALALSSVLPEDVAALSADEMPSGFDAKRHSVGKRYVYRVLMGPIRDPFRIASMWHVKGQFDVARMQRASHHLVGENDFEAFRAASCVAQHAWRYLWKVDVNARDDELTLEVRGNAFCQHMVRIIAGTLVDVGQRRFAPEDISAMLRARKRSSAGQTAPAHGLTLEEVYYADVVTHAGIPDGARFPGFPITGDHVQQCTPFVIKEESVTGW